jgi:hypothetical protein
VKESVGAAPFWLLSSLAQHRPKTRQQDKSISQMKIKAWEIRSLVNIRYSLRELMHVEEEETLALVL